MRLAGVPPFSYSRHFIFDISYLNSYPRLKPHRSSRSRGMAGSNYLPALSIRFGLAAQQIRLMLEPTQIRAAPEPP